MVISISIIIAIALFGDLQFSEVIVVLDEIIKITGSNEIVLELKG